MLPVGTIIVRELKAVCRELEAYPDEGSVWRVPPGAPNSAGTLALHLAGNFRHFVGAVLGDTGYVRDRNGEFNRRDVPRAELIEELNAAATDVESTLAKLDDARLAAEYPVAVADHTVRTDEWLVHLAVHLGYHLGQIDYHRRLTTGSTDGVGVVSPRELASARPVKAKGA